MLVVSAWSQTPPGDSKRKSVEVQVIVLGQTVPPRYEIVKSVRVEELKGAEGGQGGETLPAQEMKNVPLQIAPEADELPPSPLYIRTGKKWTMIPVRENTVSPKVSVPLGGNVVVATATVKTEEDGKTSEKYNAIAEFPVAKDQDGMLILIVKDPRQPLKWSILRTFAFNTSWSLLPAGSLTIFNASFLPLRGQISDESVDSIPNFKSLTLNPQSDSSGRVPYNLEVQHPDESWNKVVNSSTSLGSGGRIILIPYAVVLPETNRYASLVVVRDFQGQGGLEVPKPGSKDDAAESAP